MGVVEMTVVLEEMLKVFCIGQDLCVDTVTGPVTRAVIRFTQ